MVLLRSFVKTRIEGFIEPSLRLSLLQILQIHLSKKYLIQLVCFFFH